MFNITKCHSWDNFFDLMKEMWGYKPAHRNMFLFRGQASSDWALEPTLDRYIRENSLNVPRDVVYSNLLSKFFSECGGMAPLPNYTNSHGHSSTDLIARHCGLPSPIMDWSKSPYVAAYFAFSGRRGLSEAGDVSVWLINRVFNINTSSEYFDIIDDPNLVYTNQRAIEQKSVFIRCAVGEPSLAVAAGQYLNRYDIPAVEAEKALAALDEYGISRRSLFRDHDSAASTAMWQVARELSEVGG